MIDSIFKVGDVVEIADLQPLQGLNVPFGLNEDMIRMKGSRAIVESVKKDAYNIASYASKFDGYNYPDGYKYHLKPLNEEDSINPFYEWSWSSPMLKRVASTGASYEAIVKSSEGSTTPLKIKVTRKQIVLNFKN